MRILERILAAVMMSGLAACAAPSARPALTPVEATPPLSQATTAPPPEALAARPVTFETADGAPLQGELYGSGGTAIVFSVMGNCKAGWTELARAAAAQGFLALTYQWRGCQTDPNNEALLKKFLDDTRGAISFVQSQGAPRIILAGASLGGVASAQLAAEARAIGLVALAAPAEISQWDFQIEAAAVAGDTPKLFITAEADAVVPATASRALHDLAAEPKAWQTYPGTAHGTDLFDTDSGPALAQRLLAFFTEVNRSVSSPAPGLELLPAIAPSAR
ncbi:MAG: alpha/beta fold hydrolase [Anaerolineales bacterium]|nr:alpha/beta fold hydrolase [Anaerolineales bacterium]